MGGGDGDTVMSELWRTSGFASPESAVFDEKRDLIYISNIDGEPNARDFRGSVVALDGHTGRILRTIIDAELDAPKGMAVRGDILYIADIDRIVSFHLVTGEIEEYEVQGAKFLNDVTIDSKGTLYVSDMLTGNIHEYRNGRFRIMLDEGDVGYPNGLLWTKKGLLIASWGENIKDDLSTEEAGALYLYNPTSGELKTLSDKTGNLDGIAITKDGHVIVTDWVNGIIYLRQRSQMIPLAVVGKGSADLTYHPPSDSLILPMMLDNEVVAYRLNRIP